VTLTSGGVSLLCTQLNAVTRSNGMSSHAISRAGIRRVRIEVLRV
jgi:hypothetical protein